jgi:glycosyltransferase involved in cell wall biosynthesis
MSQSYSLPRKIQSAAQINRAADGGGLAHVTGAEAASRVLMATRYGKLGASSRLRLAQYRPYLEQAGFATTWQAFLSDDYVRALYAKTSRLGAIARAYIGAVGAARSARQHDLLWIEKEYLPWLPYWLERRAIAGKPYVLDFDDAWSLRYEQAGSPLVRWLFGQKFPSLLRHAALTVTANETLYEWAAREGAKNLLLLPTVIDLNHYHPVPEPAQKFTIGWIGTPLTAVYLDTIADELRQLATEAPLQLLIIGAPDKQIPGVECIHEPWSEAAEARLIGQCHAGIMPLPDDDWARGKSGYKLIQYMAMGRPAVASAIGANRQIILQDETGFLAASKADWLTALRRLRDDRALRLHMGNAARLRVEAQFCLQVTAPVLIAAMKAITGT